MSPEQEALVRRAFDELALARMALHAGIEFGAASHAYFAMLNVARAVLLDEGLDLAKHSAVIAAFGKHLSKTGRVPAHLHRCLIDAEAARIRADYWPSRPLASAQVRELIAHAEEFLRLGEQLLGPLPDTPEEPR